MTAARMLSKVSELYDVDGDGKLNETEQAMRDMDEEGKGHIDNRKVYKIMEQQVSDDSSQKYHLYECGTYENWLKICLPISF